MVEANDSNQNEIVKNYFDHMGFSETASEPEKNTQNCDKLKLAFEQAHRIREFEISLYWTRTNYFWGFQAVFFGAFGLLTQAIVAIAPENLNVKIWLLCNIIALSIAATAFCWLWLKMLSGAKFWQNNWERHIDAMENALTGPLYKTYFVQTKDKSEATPISVTKVNNMIVKLIQLFWVFIFFATSTLLYITFKPIMPWLATIPSCYWVFCFISFVLIAPLWPWGISKNLEMDLLGAKKQTSNTYSHEMYTRDSFPKD